MDLFYIENALDLRMQSYSLSNNKLSRIWFSSPIIILKIVDLPAPLGPMIPTIPACGKVKFKLS
jgi:hypothetical protein